MKELLDLAEQTALVDSQDDVERVDNQEGVENGGLVRNQVALVGTGMREEFEEAVKLDNSLDEWKGFADNNEKGFFSERRFD